MTDILAKAWRKRSLYSPLVGVHAGAAITEVITDVLKRLTLELPCDLAMLLACSTSRYHTYT